MLFYVTSRIVSAVGAFLYPGYASYKTLSQRPASEEDLERWLMYWSVLGCIVGVEYVAEWFISWIPFYYTTKTLFLLYLALPQTRGSSYLYINHLQPFFHSHETQIDAAIASFKSRVFSFVQERLRTLWEQITASLGQPQPQTRGASFEPATGASDTGAPPSMGDPISGPAHIVSSLWRSYGPSIIASGAALLSSARPSDAPAGGPGDALSSRFLHSPPPSHARAQSVQERRRQLEAELAALSKETDEGLPIPPFESSRASSSSDFNRYLRERTNSASGRFEEVEVPSDVEGYDVGEGFTGGGGGTAVEGGHEAGKTAGAQRRTSWFGWGASASKGDYERVKSE